MSESQTIAAALVRPHADQLVFDLAQLGLLAIPIRKFLMECP
jgi:hypothetical protein